MVKTSLESQKAARPRPNKFSGSVHSRQRQRGVALLFMALLVLVAVSGLLINTLADSNDLVGLSRSQDQTLRDAREALLGYAIAYPERNQALTDEAIPGYLPCPDRNGDGLSDDALCGQPNESAIGFLPWQTLGLSQPKPRDCLFYAVSGGFKSPNSQATPGFLNSDLDGSFQIENDQGVSLGGTTGRERAIAVVFHPGEQLVLANYTQVRSSGSARTHCGATTISNPINNARNYLDSLGSVNNATGMKTGASVGDPGGESIPSPHPSVFAVGKTQGSNASIHFNDKLLWISNSDYAPVRKRMNEWVLSKVRACVAAYGDIHVVGGTRRYPWPANLDSSAVPSYTEQVNQRFGRIPQTLGVSGTQWEMDPDLNYTGRCFSWNWWSDWREQIFMAVDDTNTNAPLGGPTDVQLDGSSSRFVVLLANRRMTTQTRASYANKGLVSNYLEMNNIPGTGAGLIPTGNEQFTTGAISGTFNDLACSQDSCTFF